MHLDLAPTRVRTRPSARPGSVGARLLTALLALGLVLVAGGPAHAATGTGDGPAGQHVEVTPATGLDPEGNTVRVTGSGFVETTGIYIGLCVDNGPGQQPTPCLGGVDMEGDGGSSAWISSNPPSYGEGLAQPFGPGGTFDVELTVAAADEFTDCLDPEVAPHGCAVVTRADHSRTGDRSADVAVAVTFTESGGGAGLLPVVGGALVLIVAVLVLLVVRSRRSAGGSAGSAGSTA